MLHADVAPAERLDRAVQTLYLDTAPLAPKALPGALVGLAMFGLAARLLRGISEPGQLQGVLRGLPNNVTTEMDLELWRLTERIRARPRRRGAARVRGDRRPGRRGSPPAPCRLPCRTVSPGFSASTATERSPRSISACPAGPTTRATSSGCSPTICDPRTQSWRRTPCSRPAARLEADDRPAGGRGGSQGALARAGRPVRARPHPCSWPGSARYPSTTWFSPSRRSAGTSPRWARRWPRTAASTRPMTSSS